MLEPCVRKPSAGISEEPGFLAKMVSETRREWPKIDLAAVIFMLAQF